MSYTREGISPGLRHSEGVLTLLAAGFGAGTRWTRCLDTGWLVRSLAGRCLLASIAVPVGSCGMNLTGAIAYRNGKVGQ